MFSDKEDPNDKGVYKAMLRMPKDAPETKAFIASLQDHFDRGLAEEKASKGGRIKVHEDGIPWQDEEDKDTGEPTGNIIVRTKLKAYVFLKKTGKGFDQRPKVFDANRVPITDVPAIGPGSKVRVSGQVNCWYTSKFGMTLWLEAVQLLELVEMSGSRNKAEDYGFEDENGYSVGEAYPEGDDGTPDDEVPVAKGAKGQF